MIRNDETRKWERAVFDSVVRSHYRMRRIPFISVIYWAKRARDLDSVRGAEKLTDHFVRKRR